MKEEYLEALGEDYQYVRTIVHHTVELKKIEYAEGAATVVGGILSSVIVSFMIKVLYLLCMALIAVGVYTIVESVLWSIGIILLLQVLLIYILYATRNRLFVQPILRQIYKQISS